MKEIATYDLIKKSNIRTCIEVIDNTYASILLNYAIASLKIDTDDAWDIFYGTWLSNSNYV